MRKLLAISCAIALLGCGSGEPLHKGKPAEYWKEALRGPDPQLRREAITAMGALKVQDAVPELIERLKDPDAEVRAKAAEAVWALGPKAKDAVPSLVPLLKDRSPGIRLNAAGAGGDRARRRVGLPGLRDLLKTATSTSAQAATSLGKFGPESKPAVPALAEAAGRTRARKSGSRRPMPWRDRAGGQGGRPGLERGDEEKDGGVRARPATRRRAVERQK
jgi:hypothetical protein